jgi:hypothetical protein
VGVIATTQPVSMNSVWPGCSSLQHRATGVDEGHAIAFQLLHDEAFAAEEAHAELLLQVDAQRHAAGRTQEGVLLADQHAAELTQVHRHDLAGVRGRERHPLLLGRVVGVDRGEQRLTGDQALACAQQFAEEAALAGRAVAEDGVHADAGIHEHHAAGLADRRLARV